MRAVLADYGVRTPIARACRPGSPRIASRAATARASAQRPALPRPAAAALRRARGAREEHRLPAAASSARARRASRGAAGDRRARARRARRCARRSRALGLARDVALRRLPRSRHARCSTATPPRTCSCSPRAPKPRAWCCSRRWRRARRWCRPRELGTRSILQPGCGALVVPEEAEAFAAAVVRVLTDAGLRAGLAAPRARLRAQLVLRCHGAAPGELYAHLCAPRTLRAYA